MLLTIAGENQTGDTEGKPVLTKRLKHATFVTLIFGFWPATEDRQKRRLGGGIGRRKGLKSSL